MKQKLFLFTNSFPYGKGEKTFIYSELQYLKKNFDVTIVSAATWEEKNNKNLETILDSDIEVLHFDQGHVHGIEVLRYLFSFISNSVNWKEIISILKNKKMILSRLKSSLFFYASAEKYRLWLEANRVFDNDFATIYYTYWYMHYTLALAFEKKRRPEMRIVTRAHGYDLYEERNSASWQPYKRVVSENLDGIFFISKHGHDYFCNRFLDKDTKVDCRICRIGTLKQELVIKEKANDTFQLVSCSNIVPVKRLELLIEGLALVNPSDRKIIWTHYGDGVDREKCEVLAQNKIVHKNVSYEFKGHSGNAEILNRYCENKPDCFIMVSSSEGSPVAMQEAISFGIPVIATSVGGIPEMIVDNGILLGENPSPQEIAMAIENMYNTLNPDYINMQQASYRIWEKEYNKEKNGREFLEILNDICRG